MEVTERPVRLIVVDDQILFCQLAREILSGSSQFLVVGEAYSAQRAFQLVEDLQPDVVVMDVEMEGMSGLEATQVILDRFPQVRVVLMSIYEDKEYRQLATGGGGGLHSQDGTFGRSPGPRSDAALMNRPTAPDHPGRQRVSPGGSPSRNGGHPPNYVATAM